MKARDLMTSKVYTCGPDASGADAARIMWERDVGAVPIVDREGRPLGMVTDRDLCIAAYTRGVSLPGLHVGSAMSSGAFTCRETDALGDVERVMKEHQVRRLPVLNDAGKLVGIVSLNDIVLARTQTPTAKVAERLLGDVTDTLAAICKHRQSPTQVHA